jgi:alpha-glucosidase
MPNLPAWTAGLHHDGSSLYVSNPLPAIGETVTIRLRTPADAPIQAVFLRSTPDGECHYDAMRIVEQDKVSAIWAALLAVKMPRNPYHFKLFTPEGAYYFTAVGVSQGERPEVYDFKLLANYQAPTWVYGTVFYQIFPDRFCNGDPALTVPEGAWSQENFTTRQVPWGTPPKKWEQGGTLDFYGGDLPGIIQKLDYLQDLGVNALYLTPIFASRTNHRYDIQDFFQVDPYLGGNEALLALRKALDERQMRLILDVTPNHLSWKHPWFTAAQADLTAPTAEYFTFHDNDPQKYERWLGVRSLVKLNYRSQKLRDVMYRQPDSILRYWLANPFRIDGWRLDVLNMTARQGAIQLPREVGREMRAAVKGQNPQAYLMGEHFFDGTPHLQGDELDAVMNYQGFNIPLRRWLAGYDIGSEWRDLPPWSDRTPLSSEALAEQWLAYLAAVPYVIALQQFNQLGSHDTIRFLTAVQGNKARLKLAVALLMTYVGVPCVYYGDEVGLEGGKDPDNRRCMPWDEAAWDMDLRGYYQKLIALRRNSPALQHGGFQLLYAAGEVVAYQRQSLEQRMLVIGHRGKEVLADFQLEARKAGILDGAILLDRLNGGTVQVANGIIHLASLRPESAYIFEEQR